MHCLFIWPFINKMSFTVCLTWIFVLSKRYIHTLCHNVLVLTADINNNDSCHWVALHKVHLYVSYAVCPHKAGLQETVYCMKTYLKVCNSFTTDKRYQLMALHNAGMLEIMKNKIKTSWLGQTNTFLSITAVDRACFELQRV